MTAFFENGISIWKNIFSWQIRNAPKENTKVYWKQFEYAGSVS